MVIIPNTKKPTTTKKPAVRKESLKDKIVAFLEHGKDWQVKHFIPLGNRDKDDNLDIANIVKLQILPENKTNPKRVALFITLQGRKGRKGVRIVNKETHLAVSEALLHDKTTEILEILDEFNPSKTKKEVEQDSDDL